MNKLKIAVLFVLTIGWSAPAFASQEGAHSNPLSLALVMITLILLCAKLLGELFERMGQPSVLGEILAGMLLGNMKFLFGVDLFDGMTSNDVIVALAELGAVILLFEIGLESTVGEMKKVGVSSLLVALVGVILPFALGYFATWAVRPETDWRVLMFAGATLTATSVGITARVFKDLNILATREARIILGAAVIDDVLGLIVLSVVSGIVVSGVVSAMSVLKIVGMSFGFLFGAIVVGSLLVPKLTTTVSVMKSRGTKLVFLLLFCFSFSYLAGKIGLALIVGAFAAGLILEEVHFKDFVGEHEAEELIRPISTFLVPIFFVVMGARVKFETFMNLEVYGLAAALTIAAIVGKQACGLVVWNKKGEPKLDRLTVGIGMIPRGEVGLIFASIGKELKVVDDLEYSAVVLMVIISTMIVPPLLKWSTKNVAKEGATT